MWLDSVGFWCRSPVPVLRGKAGITSLNTVLSVTCNFLFCNYILLWSSCRNKRIFLMCGFISLLTLPFGNFNSASHVLLPVSNKLRRKRRRMGTGNCSTRPAGPETLRRLLDRMGGVGEVGAKMVRLPLRPSAILHNAIIFYAGWSSSLVPIDGHAQGTIDLKVAVNIAQHLTQWPLQGLSSQCMYLYYIYTYHLPKPCFHNMHPCPQRWRQVTTGRYIY